MSNQTFISESIKPVVATVDTDAMAAGAPGLPAEFVWRGETLRIQAVLRAWKETGRCSHGSAESYVRKHWFEVETAAGQRAKIYFERQSRDRKGHKRWWLYSMEQ